MVSPQNCNTIAEAWRTEGYSVHYIDVRKEKIQLIRTESDVSKLHIPKALTEKKIPDNAIFELEQHMAYIIKKSSCKRYLPQGTVPVLWGFFC